jgi:DNA-binding NarL/FixJ family response regulator
MSDDTRDKTGPLSSRQRLALSLIAEGKTHHQIGEALGISRALVSNMLVKSILPKLNVRRTYEACARYGQYQGLLDAAEYLEANGQNSDALYLRDRAKRLLP